MIKIYFTYGHNKTREYRLIKQGLENNSRVELVDDVDKCDFVFQFAYHHKRNYPKKELTPPEKTVVIDYHDNPRWIFVAEEDKEKGWKTNILQRTHKHNGLAYFKRSWVDMVDKGDYVGRKRITWPSNFYPLTFAIMDEFIVWDNVVKPIDRDLALSCSLRLEKRNINRVRILSLLKEMNIQGDTQIGRYNKGAMDGFNDNNMKAYFKLLRRSRIVVTCNPDKWEGDHRTWEAFASGALVFVDKMATPLVHPLVDGVHCIFYDLSDSGLRELKREILHFLECPDHANSIAKRGHEFTMKYHRASNRIDEILDVVT